MSPFERVESSVGQRGKCFKNVRGLAPSSPNQIDHCGYKGEADGDEGPTDLDFVDVIFDNMVIHPRIITRAEGQFERPRQAG